VCELLGLGTDEFEEGEELFLVELVLGDVLTSRGINDADGSLAWDASVLGGGAHLRLGTHNTSRSLLDLSASYLLTTLTIIHEHHAKGKY
jgi:hypothetical protein